MPGRDVVEVAAAAGVAAGEPAAEPGAELAAEHVDEQQQEHDRHADEHQRHRRVAPQPPEVAAQHRRRIGARCRPGCSSPAASSALGWPVTAKNTSSRSGVWIDSCAISTPGVVELVEQPAQRGDAAVVGHPQDRACPRRATAVVERAPRRAQGLRRGELQPHVAARDASLELLRRALGDDPAAVEDRDPVGELVGLVQVLGGEEDRDAARRPVRGCRPTWCAGCAGRGRSWARRGRSPAASRRASSPGRAAVAFRRSRSTPACRRRRRGRTRSSSSRHPAPPRRAAEMVQVGHQPQVLLAGQQVVDRRELPGDSDRRPHPVGVGDARRGRRRAPARRRPRIRVDRIRTIVVLPAPLGPSRAKTVPSATVKVDAVEHDRLPERLAHAGDLDRRCARAGHRRSPLGRSGVAGRRPAATSAARRASHSCWSTGIRSTRKSANAATSQQHRLALDRGVAHHLQALLARVPATPRTP